MISKTIKCLFIMWYLLQANTTFAYTHADTLRGSNGSGRSWWDVQHYDLQISFDTGSHRIYGTNQINFRITNAPSDSMQIDLQEPMSLDSVFLQGTSENLRDIKLKVVKEGNVWWVKYPFHKLKTGEAYSLIIWYQGKPREAVRPPWDGGFSWDHDKNGNLWVSVSCQGLGASVWWPCKDAQWDEPDNGMVTRFFVPGYIAIGNGKSLVPMEEGKYPSVCGWEVKNPINSYDVTFYIGDYIHWHDTLMGEKGLLDLDYWVLRDNEEKARKQFAVVKEMIHCYEYWMGPYPFYEDGYKLVEAPYLGMEHQSAIAYGNKYRMGYMGLDRSMTGFGNKFDYIIIHESGHEWFGNNVTAKDMADNWIHEGITTYSESLFAEYLLGKENAQSYCKGGWLNIQNEQPVIGKYDVNEEGPGDIYEKGSAIMYMIRQMTKDDEKFRTMLRGLGKEFYHQTVTTDQVENYISKMTGLDLKAFFNQYLRKSEIPVFDYSVKGNDLSFRLQSVVKGLSLPIRIFNADNYIDVIATSEWQHANWDYGFNLKCGSDMLVKMKQ